MCSRELYELREARSESHHHDFLTVGGMGHALQIALGIAMGKTTLPIVCFDGDGALLMHMGGMPFAARQSNLIHVLLNNGCHESVGGQLTLGHSINFSFVAEPLGYQQCFRVNDLESLVFALNEALTNNASTFIEVLINPGHRSNLGRPKTTPLQNKVSLMHYLSSI